MNSLSIKSTAARADVALKLLLVALYVGCSEPTTNRFRTQFDTVNISIPENGVLIFENDEYRSFSSEGEYFAVVKIENGQQFLRVTKPLRKSSPKKFPLPKELRGQSQSLRDFKFSPSATYHCSPRGPARMPLHNGTLVIVDKEKSLIALLRWDN